MEIMPGLALEFHLDFDHAAEPVPKIEGRVVNVTHTTMGKSSAPVTSNQVSRLIEAARDKPGGILKNLKLHSLIYTAHKVTNHVAFLSYSSSSTVCPIDQFLLES